MKEEFFDWGAFTPSHAAAEMPRVLEAAEAEVSRLESSDPDGYESLVWRLNDAMRPLRRLWGAVSHMMGVMNSDAWRAVEDEWQPKVVAFSLRVGQSRRLYDMAKSLLAAPGGDLDAVCRRVLEKMVQCAELAGVGLDGAAKERFNEIQARLAKLGADFHNAVIDATKAFSFEKGGRKYTIDDASYPETMKHCADREVRERLCRARATRAPENSARIDEILRLRREEAGLLGFGSYAEMSLATKCAPSVEAVFAMIDELDEATRGPAEREDAELAAAATEAETPLEPWDQTFVAERLRERKYDYSEEELKRYFEMEDVVAGLFRLSKFLFGIDVEEVSGDAKPPVWHPDVRFFEVKEGGETVAHFYFDPFVRSGQKSGGAWMNYFRPRRRTADGVELPLALVVTNFPERGADGRCLLPMREVETIFHEFGHALQVMLSRDDDEAVSGLELLEWDAVEVASQFMENWCLDDRTGIALPSELKAKVRAAKTFRAASACRRQLALSKADLLLHVGPVDDADALKRSVFGHFGLPMVEGDRFLCSFGHVFAAGYAAGYYSYKWSEVMSADCYGAFEEANLADDEAVRRVGALYKGTILSQAGSRPALDVFGEFRGRGPKIDALLRLMGCAQH
jgi:oligopeptidase A